MQEDVVGTLRTNGHDAEPCSLWRFTMTITGTGGTPTLTRTTSVTLSVKE